MNKNENEKFVQFGNQFGSERNWASVSFRIFLNETEAQFRFGFFAILPPLAVNENENEKFVQFRFRFRSRLGTALGVIN